ncbi:MAG: tetratricopeptide repeat protein, partial [Oligoflexus sp.]
MVEKGKPSEALREARRLTGIAEKVFGRDSAESIASEVLLGTAMLMTGNYSDSVIHMETLLPRALEKIGPKSEVVGSIFNNLGVAYKSLDLQDKALDYYNRTLEIYLEIDHIPRNRIVLLNNIASLLQKTGRRTESDEAYLIALGLAESYPGAKSIDLIDLLSNIGSNMLDAGDFDKAFGYLTRALDKCKLEFGRDNWNCAPIIQSLGKLQIEVFNITRAIEYLKEAQKIYSKTQGQESESVAEVLNLLGDAERIAGNHTEAINLQNQALRIWQRIHGNDHSSASLALHDLGLSHLDAGNAELAIKYLTESLAIRSRIYGDDHPYTANTILVIGIAQKLTSKFELYRSSVQRALTIYQKNFGDLNPKTANAAAHLADYFLSGAQDAMGAALLKISVNAYQSARVLVSQIGAAELRSYTDSVAGTYQKLAGVLTDQGRLAEAQMVLDMLKEDEQFDFIRRSAGADPRRTRIGYTPTEERWMGRYREIADRLAALGKEEQALQKQAKLGLSEEQKKRQAALAADLKVAQSAFQAYLEEMRGEFAARGPARSVEFAESSVKALDELQDLLKGLGDDVALLRIYLTDEQV